MPYLSGSLLKPSSLLMDILFLSFTLKKYNDREPFKHNVVCDFGILKIPILGCYHVAVYLGNNRVVHIGSSKFIKTSKVKESKSLLGARNDHWQDFLYKADASKLIRYHLIIPFQRPEKIQEHITKAILAEYGAQTYSFLGNNCEHFATLCVCGIPFSTQADKIGLVLDKIYLDLAQEIIQNEQKFIEMTNSKTFKENLKRLKLKEIKDSNFQNELNAADQEKLIGLEMEIQVLNRCVYSFFIMVLK